MIPKRRDANHAEVVQALQRIGCIWIDATKSPSFGCDGFILFRRRMIPVEIKDGQKPPSARQLTTNELVLRAHCRAAGIPYLTVLSAEDAIEQVQQLPSDNRSIEPRIRHFE